MGHLHHKYIRKEGDKYIYFHGSPISNIEKLGENIHHRGGDSFGLWFTSSKDSAKRFSTHYDQNSGETKLGRVYEVNLDIKNPLTIDWKDFDNVYVKLFKEVTGTDIWRAKKEDSDKFREHLINNGYDGVKFTNVSENDIDDQTYLVSLHPEQIKNISTEESSINKSNNMQDLFDIINQPVAFSQESVENSYTRSLIWFGDDIQKAARVVAPVGTIHKIGETEYIKTADGWRYNKKGVNGGLKGEEPSKPHVGKAPEQPNIKTPGQEQEQPQRVTNPTVQVGHSITTPDGTVGEVLSNDGKDAVISYTDKNGQVQKDTVPSSKLEEKVRNGAVKNNSVGEDGSTLKDHHKGYVRDALEKDTPSSQILDNLKKQGVHEDEAMNHIVETKKSMGKTLGNSDKTQDNSKEVQSTSGDKTTPQNEDSNAPEDDEKHPDSTPSIKHQADNETSHDDYLKNKVTPKELEAKNEQDQIKTDGAAVVNPPELKKTKEIPMSEKTQKTAKRFDAYARSIRSVINGNSNIMIAYGGGGVGKTYSVDQQLKKAGKREWFEGADSSDYDYVKVNSKVTAAGLYQLVNEHPDKTIVFDDNDSLFEDPISKDMLKNLTDTKEKRGVDWNTASPPKDTNGKPLPKHVDFTGNIIITTNKKLAEEAKKDSNIQAILTRGPSMDLTMNNEETIDWIKHIAQNPEDDGKFNNLKFKKGPIDYTEDELKEVIEHLEKNAKKIPKDVSIRMIGTLLGQMKEAKKDWRDDARETLGLKDVVKKSMESTDIFKAKQDRLNSIYSGTTEEIQKAKRDSRVIKDLQSSDVTSEHYHTSNIEKGGPGSGPRKIKGEDLHEHFEGENARYISNMNEGDSGVVTHKDGSDYEVRHLGGEKHTQTSKGDMRRFEVNKIQKSEIDNELSILTQPLNILEK